MTGGIGLRSQEGQAGAWLLKLIVGVAVIGFVVLEFGAVVINRVQAGDIATQTASEAGIAYANSNSLDRAKERGEEYAELNGATLVNLEVNADQTEITATIHKQAATRVIHRWGALEGLREAEATETAPLRRDGGRF